uniref:Putative group iv salivary lipocalin n=1 Tax=Rhipicephalus microplus TaxID=6941 RepID=A0A6M2D6L7_RHIMP
MALVSFSLLCMFVSALLFSHTDAAKEEHENITKNMPGPWEFLTNGTIYLYSSSKFLNVTCIRAKAIKTNKSTNTSTYDVLVKWADNDKQMNFSASCVLLKTEKGVKIFTPADEGKIAVTNYTFLLTTRHCAVVAKSEGIPGADALESTELWVKNPSVTKNIITCYKEFTHVCNCNGHPTWYSAIQCEQDEVRRRLAPNC